MYECSCGQLINTFKETVVKNKVGIFMIKGECPNSDCNKWIMWVPYKDSTEVKKALEKYYSEL